MVKWMLGTVVLLLIASCGMPSKNKEKTVGASEDVLRIYSDSIGWENKLPCKITYLGKEYDAAIKFRGGISSKYPKQSMTVEFEEDVAMGGLPSNDDWILNANYIDKTFQRHKLSFDIFRKMNPQNRGPKCAYIPVYVNDKFKGLYVVMEKVNGSWMGFDKKSPGQARLFKDPFVFVEERLPNVQEPDNYYQQKFPKQSKGDFNHEPEALKTFLFQSSDAVFLQEYKNWVNEENVMDWHLLLLLTNNDDGIFKNFYLYKEADASQFQFIPWDYDHSFGRDGNYEMNLIDREVGWEKVILLRRLMELEKSGYSKRLKKRYEELRETVFSEVSLLKMIADNDDSIRPHIKANAEVWSLDSEWYLDANDYDQEIEIMKKFVPMRLQQLDDFFNGLY